MQMPPGGAPQAPEKEAPQAASGGPAELLAGAHDNLMQLMDMMAKAPSISPEDKQELAGLISGLQSFAENLGSAPGPKPEPKVQSGPVPMMAGANPNAKPAL